MRIHFPLLGFNLSGGIRVVVRIANGLVQAGHDVRITVPSFRSSVPFPLRPEVELVRVPGSSTFAYLGWLSRHAASWGDALVATGFKTPHPIFISRKWVASPAKMIYLIQGYEPVTHVEMSSQPLPVRWGLGTLARQGYGLVDSRVYVSKFVAEQVGLDPDPVLVHPGVDAEVFNPQGRVGAEKVSVGVIANPHPGKGFSTFREAWRQVPPEIAGGCSLKVLEVGESSGEMPAGAEVVRCSTDTEVSDWYRSVDIFVFPSLFEGFGLPPLEAMACGCSVITSDCGGVREFVVDRVNSWVVPPGNSLDLKEAMVQLATSPNLRAQLAVNGFETASQFSWESTVASFVRFLEGPGDSP